MGEAILNTNLLPSPIKERFNTKKITIRNHESGVLLMPLKDIATHRGIAKDNGFTADTLLANREDENADIPQAKATNPITKDECPLLGIAADSSLTVEKFLAMKREDKLLEGSV